MFASTALVARIEGADCRMIKDVAAVTAKRSGEDVFVRDIAGGVAAFTVAGSPFNKVAGLGFGGPVDTAELEEVERVFAARGAPVQIELSCLAEPSIGAMLTRRGYALQGFENVLGRPLSDEEVGATPAEIEIAPIEDREFATWLDVLVTGFGTPDTQGLPSHESFPREVLERVISDMVTADGFTLFLAKHGGVPVGGGSMRVWNRVAHMCGAATLPEYRRRGVQTGLLAARTAAAGRAGCDVAVVTTQPGSKSQENVQRHGFAVLFTRAVLVREF